MSRENACLGFLRARIYIGQLNVAIPFIDKGEPNKDVFGVRQVVAENGFIMVKKVLDILAAIGHRAAYGFVDRAEEKHLSLIDKPLD